MATHTFDYVVLGGGTAAGYVADAFVQNGLEEGKLAIVSEEPYAPYERPALSKGFLLGKAKLPGFHTCVGSGGDRHEPQWYTDHGIQLHTNTRIVKAELQHKRLTAEDGNSFVASKALILATGASVIRLTKNPGHDLQGIHYLRNVADGEKLLAGVANAKSAVMIGGGYIGMECAAAVASQGVAVTLVFPRAHLMERLFTPELAAFYEKVFAANGVKFVKNARCTEFVGQDGRVTGCKLNTGETIEADLVVVGVGAQPNVELFEGQVNMADRPMGGILVDSSLMTSVSDVYAIGDIAAFPLKKYSRIQRVEHVTGARQTAAHAVQTILGNKTEYDYLPHFYSRVFNQDWKFWGENVGEVVVRGTMTPKLLAVWIHNQKAMGVFIESGTPEEQQQAKQVAIDQPVVDLDALKAVDTVESALVLLTTPKPAAPEPAKSRGTKRTWCGVFC